MNYRYDELHIEGSMSGRLARYRKTGTGPHYKNSSVMSKPAECSRLLRRMASSNHPVRYLHETVSRNMSALCTKKGFRAASGSNRLKIRYLQVMA